MSENYKKKIGDLQIAQGWDDDSMLALMRNFVEALDIEDELYQFLEEQADREQDESTG